MRPGAGKKLVRTWRRVDRSIEDELVEDVEVVDEAGPAAGIDRLRVCERTRDRNGGMAERVAVKRCRFDVRRHVLRA